MLSRGCGNALIGEQPLIITRPGTVITDNPVGIDDARQQVGPHRGMHVQKNRKPSAPELAPDIEVSTPAGRFVEDDKLDVINAFHQLVFQFADDPGEPRLRPCGLD